MPQQFNAFGQPIGPAVPDWQGCVPPPATPMEGTGCRLEPLDPSRHGQALYQAFCHSQDDRDWTYLPYGPFPSLHGFLDWLQTWALGEDPLFHAILDPASGETVGMASYLRIAPELGSIEVGHIHFSPLMQRTPLATEAMYLMMARVFDQLGYRRYEWKCDALNERSRQAALRLGFSFEGIFRQMMVTKGRNRDSAWFSIIDKEWPKIKRAHRQWLSPGNFGQDGRQLVSLRSLTARGKAG